MAGINVRARARAISRDPSFDILATDYDTYLDQELRTFDIRNQRYGIIDRQPSCAVTMRHEIRDAAGAAVSHRQVDHEIELLPRQEVGEMTKFARAGILVHGDVLERPLHRLHLRQRDSLRDDELIDQRS